MREPVVAGSFYPRDPGALLDVVDGLLDASTGHLVDRPWAVVVPHAGYRYSGPIAASAYAALRPWAPSIRRVLLLGPAHFVPLTGCATTAASAWRTPLGSVEIDDAMRQVLGCRVDDAPHEREHSIEVQLPFLQRLLDPGFRIVPVAVGRGPDPQVTSLLGSVQPDLVVVSTDLSHYLELEAARTVDRRTADAVLARASEAIGPDDACGVFALRGAVAFARSTDRPIALLDLRTSGDTAGDPTSVVGYGAFAIGRPGSGPG